MRKLTEFERHVIEDKGTERPFSGEYNQHDAPGVYHCKRCDAPLYLSEHKFNAHCGWPAFDDEIPGAVKRVPDADGHRTEIVCHQCGGHLGHLFEGEYLTDKNLRHCVNSVSMVFKGESRSQAADSHIQWATLAGGCFWCLEAIFAQLRGVISVKSGYAGGDATTANYREVCGGDTGHAEVVQIEFDSHIISFEELLEVFWQSHDPTTLNRQGNDVGTQYRSAIFAHNDVQIKIATQMIKQLADANVFDKPIVTELVALDTFYPAESYHDAYFEHNSEQPYCQMVVKPKVEKVKALFKQRLKSGTV